MPTRKHHRKAFTLIEVLIVIAIIGILVGLIVPTANYAWKRVVAASIAIEVQTLGNAVEQYKNKFGDYPPDGSNAADFSRHCRKAFPNIAATELALLGLQVPSGSNPVANSSSGLTVSVMDPAEALVFFLGGFSDDATYPFTGPGGPLFLMDSSGAQVNSGGAYVSVQYNVDRNAPLFEFKQERLSLFVTPAGLTYSNDEALLFGAAATANDRMPVYNPGRGRVAPFVYFDSRSYSFPFSGKPFFNFYNPTNIGGVARPYKSDEVNTTVAQSTAPDRYFRYANDRSFQIISAGLDDAYGGVIGTPATSGTPVFYRYPSGASLDIMSGTEFGNFARYTEVAGEPSAQLDNATNFADGTLDAALPN